MIENMNILLVDDHLVVRKGVEIMLKDKINNVIIYSVANYDEALTVLKSVNIQLVLLDININGVENIKIMSEMKSIRPKTKVLIFSSHDEKQYGLRYVQHGADGYLDKLSSEDKIILAVSQMIIKGSFYSKEIEEKINNKTSKKSRIGSIENLSNREYEISRMLVNGYGNLEIANKLNIQMSTVSTYKNRVFEKLNINNVVALAELFKQE
jgi:DNA-binding NarL/FixJ family response regulator